MKPSSSSSSSAASSFLPPPPPSPPQAARRAVRSRGKKGGAASAHLLPTGARSLSLLAATERRRAVSGTINSGCRHLEAGTHRETREMRGGVLSMLAVLVAVSSAFSPTALSPRSAVSLRVRPVSAPVAMAGWNDEYQDNDPGRKKQVCACATFSPAVCDAHRPCCTHTHTHGQAHGQSVGRAVADPQDR